MAGKTLMEFIPGGSGGVHALMSPAVTTTSASPCDDKWNISLRLS
jgi:hypothetical protein